MVPSGSWHLDWELVLRLGFFIGIFSLLAIAEFLVPRRAVAPVKAKRWLSNLSVVVFNTVAVRLIFPLMAIDIAYLAAERHWGLFHIVDLPYFLPLIMGVLILDLAIYLQHVLFHFVPLFWRFHRMHHADIDIDVTTGTRFHPIEILLSMGIKMAVVITFGISVLSVLIFEILLNATSMFTHSNIRLPLVFDRLIRLFFVTPDMHRVHHSIDGKEMNSNFGFNLSIWDRFFRTYKDQPAAGHQKMTIGTPLFRESKFLKFHWMLAIPFISRSKNPK